MMYYLFSCFPKISYSAQLLGVQYSLLGSPHLHTHTHLLNYSYDNQNTKKNTFRCQNVTFVVMLIKRQQRCLIHYNDVLCWHPFVGGDKVSQVYHVHCDKQYSTPSSGWWWWWWWWWQAVCRDSLRQLVFLTYTQYTPVQDSHTDTGCCTIQYVVYLNLTRSCYYL